MKSKGRKEGRVEGRKDIRKEGVDRGGEGGKREEIVEQRSSSEITFVDSDTKVGSQICSEQLKDRNYRDEWLELCTNLYRGRSSLIKCTILFYSNYETSR